MGLTSADLYVLIYIRVKELVEMAGSKMNKRDLQAYLALNAAATKKSRNKKKYTRKGKNRFSA